MMLKLIILEKRIIRVGGRSHSVLEAMLLEAKCFAYPWVFASRAAKTVTAEFCSISWRAAVLKKSSM